MGSNLIGQKSKAVGGGAVIGSVCDRSLPSNGFHLLEYLVWVENEKINWQVKTNAGRLQ